MMTRSPEVLTSSLLVFVIFLLSSSMQLTKVACFQSSSTELALKRQRKPTIGIQQENAGCSSNVSFRHFSTKSSRYPFSDSLQRRLLADPDFIRKSVAEVTLAALTQFLAEVGRRGKNRILPEIDFVLAGVLTAVAGKYYSMWKVAPTAATSQSQSNLSVASDATTWWERVPTNAFQGTCYDGSSPNLPLRLASFIKPIPSLFLAGFISSIFGYGITAVFITLRSFLLPYYVSQTQNVNIICACLYTGCFMAIVSNIRYQLLSGVIEPKIIDKLFKDRYHPSLHECMVLIARLANGFVGSVLAIAGMRWLGLQKLK